MPGTCITGISRSIPGFEVQREEPRREAIVACRDGTEICHLNAEEAVLVFTRPKD